MEMISLPL